MHTLNAGYNILMRWVRDIDMAANIPNELDGVPETVSQLKGRNMEILARLRSVSRVG